MARMSVDVTTVSFQEDKAEATVAFGLKDGGQGMQMNYSLTRKGDVWEVKPRAAGGAHGGASPLPPPSSPAMPPGHPPTGANQ